jgi:hypothetical protein
MSTVKCPQCGAGTFASACPRCQYSSSVCGAGASSGHRGMDPFRWVKIGALLPVAFLAFLVVGLNNASNTQPSQPSSAGVLNQTKVTSNTGTLQAGTLQVRLAAEQSRDGLEVFIDGVVQPPFFGTLTHQQ